MKYIMTQNLLASNVTTFIYKIQNSELAAANRPIDHPPDDT
jgi:hypothetical protein